MADTISNKGINRQRVANRLLNRSMPQQPETGYVRSKLID